jgi:hypothetical protein
LPPQPIWVEAKWLFFWRSKHRKTGTLADPFFCERMNPTRRTGFQPVRHFRT